MDDKKTSNPVEQVFGAGGVMAKAFPGYEPRAGQIEYSNAVFNAIDKSTRLMAEGPTGTGKSVGYLVPAIYFVASPEGKREILTWRAQVAEEALLESGFDPGEIDPGDRPERDAKPEDLTPRVVICTANIALQEQLMGKDLPELAKLLPWNFNAAIAKGRNNFLCLERFDDSATELLMEPLRDPNEREQWNTIAKWKTETQRGDFSELPFELAGPVRLKVATTSDDCTGKACPRFADCHAEAARKRFRAANVIVSNYHMLFAHLAIATETGTGLLPRFDILIMDEAHEAADVAREFFGFTIRSGSFKWATRFLGPKPAKSKGTAAGYDIDPEMRGRIIDHATDLFDALARFRNGPKYRARLFKKFDGWEWESLVKDLRRAADMMDKTASLGAAQLSMPGQRQAELRKAQRRCMILAANLEAGLDPTKDVDGDYAFFLEDEPRGMVSLRAKPIDVAPLLRKKLFDNRAFRSVVVTSATLATGTGDDAFDFAVKELGSSDADELIVESPFDFRTQSLLVIPKKLPDPKSKTFSEEIGDLACEVVRLADGRMLGLFTSHKGVRAAAVKIRQMFGSKYTILVQGDAPRTRLIAQFRADTRSVLLGTRSMWAGVDVSGESLSAVFVDKLPFDPPTDPILDALNERSSSTFMDYSVPRAAIAMRQGFGRLIRSRTDRGVVVIGDSRMTTKGFGRKIKAALPRSAFSNDVAEIATFLGEVP